jgi:hypothetical protein
MGRDYADRLITSSKVVGNIDADHGQQIPISERQTRPLAKLESDQQQEAWQKEDRYLSSVKIVQ